MEIVAQPNRTGMVNVLVVEDQPLMQLFYRKILSPVTERCFNLVFAPTLRSAIDALDFEETCGTGIAYALLDWALPDGTAVTLFNHIWAKGYTLRCMLVSGHNDRSMLEFAACTGMVDAFIRKPSSTVLIQQYWKKYVCPYSRLHHPDECCFSHSTPLSVDGAVIGGVPAATAAAEFGHVRH